MHFCPNCNFMLTPQGSRRRKAIVYFCQQEYMRDKQAKKDARRAIRYHNFFLRCINKWNRKNPQIESFGDLTEDHPFCTFLGTDECRDEDGHFAKLAHYMTQDRIDTIEQSMERLNEREASYQNYRLGLVSSCEYYHTVEDLEKVAKQAAGYDSDDSEDEEEAKTNISAEEAAYRSAIVYRKVVMQSKDSSINSIPSSVSDDPTMTRSKGKCPAPGCGGTDLVVTRGGNKSSLEVIFVCATCGHKWV